MKIVHVCKYFYPHVTGVTSYIHSLSRELISRGHEVSVLSWGDASGWDEVDGIPVKRVRTGNKPAFYEALADIKAEKGIDLINAHSIWNHVPMVAEFSSKSGVPFVVTMHGTWMFIHSTGAYNSLWGRFWYGWWYRRVIWPRLMRDAAGAIVLNNDEWELTQSWRVSASRVFRIPNAVDAMQFSPHKHSTIAPAQDLTAANNDPGQENAAGTTAESSETAKPVKVMFASAIQAQKGVYTLLRAAEILRDEGLPVVWSVCGTGPAVDDVKAYCKLHNLEDVVTLEGAVPREEMPERFRQADIVTLPSYNEPFATVFLEAMASGKPCVGAGAGGTTEIIKEGETGFVVPFDDAVQLAERVRSLAENPRLRQRLGTAGRERVLEAYTWPAVASRIEEAYEQVLRV